MTNLTTFDYDMLDELKYNPSIVLCSARGGGKSYLLETLMNKLDSVFKYSHIFGFSMTDRATQQMKSFIPDNFIFEDLSPLQEIMDTRLNSDVPIKKRSNICIVLNDISGLREQNTYNKNSRSIKNSGNLERLFTLGRHQLRATIVVLCQGLQMISPLVRLNTDLTFFWVSKSAVVRKAITEQYLGLVPKKEALSIYHTVFNGTPYQCLVICSFMQGTTSLEQFCFTFLAPAHMKWKSKFVKRYNKDNSLSKKKKKLKTNQKNNVFRYYNEVEKTNRINSNITESKPNKGIKIKPSNRY